jgi:hypothetical protein
MPYDGSDAYALNVAIDPLKDLIIERKALFLVLNPPVS